MNRGVVTGKGDNGTRFTIDDTSPQNLISLLNRLISYISVVFE